MKHIWRIITFTRELWPIYLIISFLSVTVASIGLLQPLLSGWAIDAIKTNNTDTARVIGLVIGIFLSDLALTFINNVNGYLGDQMSTQVQRILGQRYYQQLLALPQSYFDQELTGKIINRLHRSINQIASFMQMWSNNFLQFVFSTVLALGIIAHYSWPVALLLLTLYPTFIFMTIKSSGKWQAYQKTVNEHTDIANGRFAESVSQVRVVKSFLQEAHELRFFDGHLRKVQETVRPQSRHWHMNDVRRRLALNIIFLGVYLFVFTQAASGALTAGQAVALILYAAQIRIPIFTISFLVDNTQRAIADSKDYFDVMSIKPDISDAQDATSLEVSEGRVVFNDVSFGYNEKMVLKNVNLTVEPDSKVALVGESGEGKTTLTNLLFRLYQSNNGAILIDGQDIQTVTQASLRAAIGVVFQEPALFSGTIAENISYGKPKATKAEIRAAAKAANADEFINKLDKGYDTEIGEQGLKLSGGQKQRIAIARALLKDAPILVLDEATSSLDSRSEQMVQQALERLMKGRTTIIIAHRLSTIQNVDQVITLKNGTVDEIGPPSKLSKTKGIYAQLLALQQGATDSAKQKLKAYEIAS